MCKYNIKQKFQKQIVFKKHNANAGQTYPNINYVGSQTWNFAINGRERVPYRPLRFLHVTFWWASTKTKISPSKIKTCNNQTLHPCWLYPIFGAEVPIVHVPFSENISARKQPSLKNKQSHNHSIHSVPPNKTLSILKETQPPKKKMWKSQQNHRKKHASMAGNLFSSGDRSETSSSHR